METSPLLGRPVLAALALAGLALPPSSQSPAPAATSAVRGFDCVVPPNPSPVVVRGVDGVDHTLAMRGDGFAPWYEDLDGRPLVEHGGRLVYATLESGALRPTGLELGSPAEELAAVQPVADRPIVRPVPRIGLAAERTPGALNPSGQGAAPGLATGGAGSVDNLVLLLRFSNHGPGGQNRTLPSSSDVSVIMNQIGGSPTLAPTGSVRDHYLETSYGQFTIDSTVAGWFDLPSSETFYANGNSGLTSLTWQLITDGLDAADASIDFSQFDQDGDGWIDAITFLHSGYGAEWGGTDQYGTGVNDRIWSHKWSIPVWTSAEGVKVSDYNISPGLWATSGSSPGRIGVVVHELGHFFGLPDLYDTDGSSQGIGNWCIMAGGSWGFDGSQQHPSHHSAWARMKMGWVSPTLLLPGTHSAPRVETNPSVFRLESGYPVGEYVLVENRQQTGFDSALPQGGLCIWHIDETKGSMGSNDPNTDEGFSGQTGWPTNGRHYRNALLQADNGWDMERNLDRGDSGDVYRTGGVSSITGTTSPNLRAYQGGTIVANDNRITGISTSSATMSFTYSNPSSPSITTASLPAGEVGQPYSQSLGVTGGTGSKTWSEVIESPAYATTQEGSSGFAAIGTAQGWRADEATWTLNLPFAFPFFERSYTSVTVSSNGFIDMVPVSSQPGNQRTHLKFEHRIAPLWDDLRTDGTGDNVFVDTSVADVVTVRWRAHHFDTNALCNFSVELHRSGRIVFHYGSGNSNISPTVGISRGHSGDVLFVPGYDGATSLSSASSYRFDLSGSQIPPGMQLASNGTLSGTPSVEGTFEPVFRATDASFVFAQTALTLTVAAGGVVADFTGAPTSGVAPLAVSFTDASTGTISTWAWTFGDGGTSTLASPSHTYTTPGTYTVALTVTGPLGSDTLTRTGYISVGTPPPVAEFTGAPLAGVAPLAVTFTDASTGSISSHSWDFGDGGSSTLASPSHTYTTPGTYTVALTVTGPGGSDTRTRTNYVSVGTPPPIASFSGAPLSGTAPLSVVFADASTGSITSYSWDFGDGGSSTQANPTHVYSAPGTYSVALTVTGPGGSDVHNEPNYVVVGAAAPVADFTGSPTSGAAPLSVLFSDLSTGSITSYSWDFGDGGSSSLASPSHDYTTPGTYTVALTVTGPGGSDTLTRTDYVSVSEPAPVADFTGSPTSGPAPLAVSFTDASTGSITSYSWDFGDGGSSTAASPSHTYTASGTYTVALTVTGPGGSDTLTRTDYISVDAAAPVADFTGAPTSGQAPLAVSFTDASTGSITSHSWNFGDGGSSTQSDPVHAYTSPGTYSVSLTVTGPGGSDTLTRTDYVSVTEPAPIAEFSAAPTSGFAPLAVSFNNLTSGNATTWSWDFGDGGSSILADPVHTYTAAGTYTVSLTATGPGGSDTETKANLISVSGPGIADPSFESQNAGTLPGGPWSTAGTGHRVQPLVQPTDGDMPSDGSQWCMVSALGTNDATPPSNPGGVTSLPVGAAGITQSFLVPSGTPVLVFEAAFLRNEPADQAARNDWMSVDVTDGTTAHNVYYKDTFSPAPDTSTEHSLAMTPVEVVGVDLESLFPLLTSSTLLTIHVQAGNGGDGTQDSLGYVDNFRFYPPADAVAYGCGVNPANSLVIVSGEPRLGTTLTFGVDNPLGTQGAGSIPVLAISALPWPTFPCGIPIPGTGMGGGAGELLVRTGPFLLRPTPIGTPWSGPGNPAPVDFNIPFVPSILGYSLYVQGVLVDLGATTGPTLGLAGAFQITLAP